MELRSFTLMCLFALLLGGCLPAGDEAGSPLPAVDEPAASGSADDDDAEYRRRVAVWLMSDDDKDGLSNKIELDFGLDPEDPTDGMDIDGDGAPNFRDRDADGDGITNETDPDVDGDKLSNEHDGDVDGDGVSNGNDFDTDADGVRNKWDWDDNSNDKDDANEEDEDGKLGELEDEDLRFSAAVQASKDKLAAAAELTDPELRKKAMAQYESDLRDLLAQVGKVGHEGKPIPVDGKEVDLIAKSLANRFKWGGSPELASELKTTISQLTPQPDPTTSANPDPTDAIDAVFRQATEVKDPKEPKASQELHDRLAALAGLKNYAPKTASGALAPGGAMICSDAVDKLVAMPGEGKLEDKVNGVTLLWNDAEKPDLGSLVGDLGTMAGSLQSRTDNWSWGAMVNTLTRLDKMPGEGTLQEKFETLMRLWDATGEPLVNELVEGLGELTTALEDRLTKEWGWDVLVTVLENAPDIKNGIDAQQIDYIVEEVGKIVGE